MSGTPESTTFNYVISLLPQLITIIAAIAAGFKAMSLQNDKKIKDMENDILKILENEKVSLKKDIEGIGRGIENLDKQYKIITEYIKENVERHERMLERLDTKNIGRYGGASDIEHR